MTWTEVKGVTWTEVKGPKADPIIFQKRKKISLYENLTIFFLYGHFGVLKLRSLFIFLIYRYKSIFVKRKNCSKLVRKNRYVKRTCFASIKY